MKYTDQTEELWNLNLKIKTYREATVVHINQNLKLMRYICFCLFSSGCHRWPLLFILHRFDFQGRVMQPAPAAPSSLQVTGLPVQDVCLHSTEAPTNPVLQTSYISAACHCVCVCVCVCRSSGQAQFGKICLFLMDECQSRYSELPASCRRFTNAKRAISSNTVLSPCGTPCPSIQIEEPACFSLCFFGPPRMSTTLKQIWLEMLSQLILY